MSEPTKEAIFAMTISTSGESWATVTKDGALKLDEAKCHALAQEFMNGNVTQGTSIAMLVSAIIARVRKQARDDALERAAKQCDDLNVKCCGNNTFGCCGQPNEWEGWDPIYGEMIRALKDQPTGEPQ